MILITGANGFLGYYLTGLLLKNNYRVLATGKGSCRLPYMNHAGFMYKPLDFTDAFAVHDVFEKYHPQVVIHAGAMSKPDECELNQWACYEINVQGTLNLLAHAEDFASFFIFLSTDFVFSGEKGMYKEEDEPAPVNFYGLSKADAEEAVKAYPYNWAIVRTVLVYGKPQTGKHNLITIVKDKLQKHEVYHVVDDQFRTPTYVEDLASGILAIVEKKTGGIYHLSGKEMMTPYEMAMAVADYLELDKSVIHRATAADFSQPAKRPSKTGFVLDKAKDRLGYEPVSFAEGLRKTLEE